MTKDAQSDRRGLGSRHRLAVWSGGAALMLLPVLVLRLAEGSTGDPGDFVFLAILLAGVGGAYELATRATDRNAYPVAVAIAVGAALLNVWITLAVGIIGSEDNPANWMYAGPLAIAVAGSALARFRPAGMARSMAAAAIAQLLVFMVALVAGLGFTGPITMFFTGLWLISAWLFGRAARAAAPAASA